MKFTEGITVRSFENKKTVTNSKVRIFSFWRIPCKRKQYEKHEILTETDTGTASSRP